MGYVPSAVAQSLLFQRTMTIGWSSPPSPILSPCVLWAAWNELIPLYYVTPPLTTVRQPRLRLSQQAMRMALKLLDGEEVQDQQLDCELIVRETTTKT
jgi:DNA-binding LacI/PurR family transcriptional regulator